MIFEKNIKKIYTDRFFIRYDDNGCVFYFSAEDFEGLRKEPYDFVSSLGHSMHGYFYFYDNFVTNRLIIFDHGFGGGHRAYMKEIEMLCRRGFSVFAYDHTGCMESGGESTNGLAQSLCDLNDCINALKTDGKCDKKTLSVIGHSWGGFSCLNIASFHPDITHIVAVSGFISVSDVINQFFGGILKGYRRCIFEIEKRNNSEYAFRSAIDALGETSAEVLVIHSADDRTIKKAAHFDKLKNELCQKENIRFLLVDGKGHNPNYTADAVKYKDRFFADYTKKVKKKLLSTQKQKSDFIASYDWNRMTAQNLEVWERIFEHLNR